MRLLGLVLLVLLVLIQYPLWWGKGGWLQVWNLQRQVAVQRETNEGLRARNAALDAEVRDLRTGTDAIEEQARSELGMMREGEVFVQILPQNTSPLGDSANQRPPILESARPPRKATPLPAPAGRAAPAAAAHGR
jgi:cell division protein FtsB